MITPGVVKLRDSFALPGMKILQFAFSGPDKKFLYVGTMGATIGPNGTEFATTPQERNTAMTVYKMEMLTPGFKGRAK